MELRYPASSSAEEMITLFSDSDYGPICEEEVNQVRVVTVERLIDIIA
jgi:hypothetical protein